MSYDPFVKITSSAIPIALENIDTDQIIPARFLKATERKGFGDNLFRDWKYNKEGEVNTDFPLNQKKYSGKILVAGKNFGSGSSREHAAWAIYDYGFRAVVSSFFADIFKNNALNTGIVPVVVPEETLENIFKTIETNPNSQFTIDLENKQFINCTTQECVNFEINGYKQECLMRGIDDIGYLQGIEPEIVQWETEHSLYSD